MEEEMKAMLVGVALGILAALFIGVLVLNDTTPMPDASCAVTYGGKSNKQVEKITTCTHRAWVDDYGQR